MRARRNERRVSGAVLPAAGDPKKTRDEFLLAATAQNLRKMAKLIAVPAPIGAT
jgi:hypothetical protein